jgi:hypothetical protein
MPGKVDTNKGLLGAAIALGAACLFATPAAAVNTLPILWEAGGQSAGTDGAGQAARAAADPAGNVAVV